MAKESEEKSRKPSELEEGEDEALSLCDLPLDFINKETIPECSKEATQMKDNEEEFNFDSWGGSLSAESEMCAADEVFFKGQILPLRLSVSSDSGLLARFQNHSGNNGHRRSESLDRGSSSTTGGFTSSNSSRSSSARSQSSSRSNSFIVINSTKNSGPKIRNQFHSFPSPKPQIRVSNSRLQGNSSRSQHKSTTVWDFFRIGLVRAPEIELQDLKARNSINSCVSRNSSTGSSSSTNGSGVAAKNQRDLKLGQQMKKKKQSFLDMRKGLFSGCKCSVAVVETVPLNNIVIIESNADHESSSTVEDMGKKLQGLKIKRKVKEKQAMSRHRTFEWLKELSHADFVDAKLPVL